MSRSISSSFRKPSREASSLRRVGIVTASVLLGSSLIIPGVVSSAQASSTCPSGATTLSSGACEISFTSSSTFTPPAGTTQLHALLVGAGGSAIPDGSLGYAGGGGDVQVVTLATSGDVTITVGAAGTSSGYSSANDTSVTQAGSTTTAEGGRPAPGGGADHGGDSGSGISTIQDGGSGAGAASTDASGGVGLVVNEITGASSTLFSDDTDCFGGGGGVRGADATCGGGYTSDTANPLGTNPPLANSGGGGGGWSYYDGSVSHAYTQEGAAGLVTLRFEVSALPDTGVASTAPWVLSALGLLAAGSAAALGALSLRLRRR
jgi:hypothetical protein